MQGRGSRGDPTGGVPPDRFGRVSGTARSPQEIRGQDIRGQDARAKVSYRAVREAPAEKPMSYVPWPLRLLVRFGITAAVLAVVALGPGYFDCRQRREAGLLYYGVTMGACTRHATWEHVGNLQRRFETIARAVGAH